MIPIKNEVVLIKPADIVPSSPKVEVIAAINPAAARMKNGEILLLVRIIEKLKKSEDKKHFFSPRLTGNKDYRLVLDKFSKKKVINSSEMDFSFADGTKRLTFISHLRRVILDSSGLKVKSIDRKPTFYGLKNDGELGIEDPRIIFSAEEKKYLMTYVTLSREHNVSTSLAESRDLRLREPSRLHTPDFSPECAVGSRQCSRTQHARHVSGGFLTRWKRKGIIFEEQNKDVVLFPEKINDTYIALNRPEGNFQFSSPDITVSYSHNLKEWGNPKQLRLAKDGSWDSGRVGAGPPPLKTKHGWLFIYHGVIDKHTPLPESFIKKIEHIFTKEGNKETQTRITYVAGAALLAHNNPLKVISKSPLPIIYPRRKYEKGTFERKDVFFPTGLVMDKNGKDILLFSGGGDIITTVKKISLDDIFKAMRRF